MKTLADDIAQIIIKSSYLVVFTGAGISTASGIPDYRSPFGLISLRESGMSLTQFRKNSKPWYEFEPNEAHEALVKLQNMKLLKFLISQNVDGLHLKSGIRSDLISELHGNAKILLCINCQRKYYLEDVGWIRKLHGFGSRNSQPVKNQPSCPNCQSRLISTIVDFGDPLPEYEVKMAKKHSKNSDVFIVIGSSLAVNPASSFPRIASKSGSKLIIINLGKTKLDPYADIKIEADVTIFLPKVIEAIENKIE